MMDQSSYVRLCAVDHLDGKRSGAAKLAADKRDAASMARGGNDDSDEQEDEQEEDDVGPDR